MTDFMDDTAILATDSGTLAIGLSALLLSIPPIEQVHPVADVNSLLGNLAILQPRLIILDSALLGARMPEILTDVRNLSPKSLLVLLNNNMAEYRELADDSRHTVVIDDTDPGRLAHTLEHLLIHYAIA